MWHSAKIERVACSRLKRANPALAEEQRSGLPSFRMYSALMIRVINRGAESALEQHGQSAAADFFQERKLCMFRVPTCRQSAYFSIMERSRGSMTSVTTGQARFRARFGEEAKSVFA